MENEWSNLCVHHDILQTNVSVNDLIESLTRTCIGNSQSINLSHIFMTQIQQNNKIHFFE